MLLSNRPAMLLQISSISWCSRVYTITRRNHVSQACYLKEKWYDSVIVFIKPGSAVLHADKTSFIHFGICYPPPWRKYIYPLPLGESERWWYLNNLNVAGHSKQDCVLVISFFSCVAIYFPFLLLVLSVGLLSMVSLVQVLTEVRMFLWQIVEKQCRGWSVHLPWE